MFFQQKKHDLSLLQYVTFKLFARKLSELAVGYKTVGDNQCFRQNLKS